MGMFDWFQPEPQQKCPVCDKILSEWQGYDGPCLLFVWRQGAAAPVAHRGDGEDFQVSDSDLNNWRLPNEFVFYSYDCQCPYPVEAKGRTENEVWASTELINASNARQRKSERKGEFKQRLKWLASTD
jgi:hypothetical protein